MIFSLYFPLIFIYIYIYVSICSLSLVVSSMELRGFLTACWGTSVRGAWAPAVAIHPGAPEFRRRAATSPRSGSPMQRPQLGELGELELYKMVTSAVFVDFNQCVFGHVFWTLMFFWSVLGTFLEDFLLVQRNTCWAGFLIWCHWPFMSYLG